MPDGHPIEIVFPAKGIHAAGARQMQPEGTAPPEGMYNMIPFDRLGRGRGAQRPGCAKLFPSALAVAPVLAMGQAAVAIDPSLAPLTTTVYSEPWTEYANGTNLNATGNWSSTATGYTVVNPGGYVQNATGIHEVFYAGPQINLAGSYMVQATFTWDGTNTNIFAVLAKYSGTDVNSGVRFVIQKNAGQWQYSLLQGEIGNIVAPTNFTFAPGVGSTFTLGMKVSGNTFTGFVNGTLILAPTTSAVGAGNTGVGWQGGNTAGFQMNAFTVLNGLAASYRHNYLAVTCNGSIYLGDLSGLAVVTGGTAVLNAGVRPCIAWGHQNFYIVDGSTIQQVQINNKSAAALAATAGTLPTGCYIVAVWRDRLLLTGDPTNPQNIYASRVGTYTDWDYSQIDPAAAFAFNASTAGHIGEPVNSLVPLNDDLMLIGGDHNLWMMRGDPADGGSIDLISDNVGIFGQWSWCKSPDGTVYFAGPGGLYRINGDAPPQEVAAGRYLEWFRGINRVTTYVQLVWDRDRHGCYIFQSPVASNQAGAALWYDARNDGFFALQYPNDIGPMSCLAFDGDASTDRALLLGGRSGLIRQIQDAATTDDGQAIAAYFIAGPYKPGATLSQYTMAPLAGSDLNDGELTGVDVILGELPAGFAAGNWNCSVTVQAAHDANLAINAPTRQASKAFTTPGRQRRWLARIRGVSMFFKFWNNTSGTFFSFERATGWVMGAGRERR